MCCPWSARLWVHRSALPGYLRQPSAGGAIRDLGADVLAFMKFSSTLEPTLSQILPSECVER